LPAGIYGAKVIVRAIFWHMDTFASCPVAGIVGAKVLVCTRLLDILTSTSLRVAGIACAWIVVVANNRRVHTLPRP
jgi:ribulose 1,5-bisphosphate synthetase/thiazole synthase